MRAHSLPCLESSPACLAELTELAIANSSEIEVIEQRLDLAAERRQQTESRWWVNWITIDPFELVQNVLGGGNVGRDRLQVAALEVEE